MVRCRFQFLFCIAPQAASEVRIFGSLFPDFGFPRPPSKSGFSVHFFLDFGFDRIARRQPAYLVVVLVLLFGVVGVFDFRLLCFAARKSFCIFYFHNECVLSVGTWYMNCPVECTEGLNCKRFPPHTFYLVASDGTMNLQRSEHKVHTIPTPSTLMPKTRYLPQAPSC